MTAPIRRVLVAFGSKRGGTAGIAMAIADALRAQGLDVDCMRAAAVRDVASYDAFVVGGALYAARWISEARRFVTRHAATLRAHPVWLFSSGPLDDSADQQTIGPVRGVERLMARIGAQGHVTFGGRLRSDATGFPAAAMAKSHAGDWRSWDRIKKWACEIAQTLVALPEPVAPPARPVSGLLATICLVIGTTAIAGGIALVARPDGALLHMPVSTLSHSPFSSFLVPGILLLCVIGTGHVVAAWLVIRNRLSANAWAFASGAALFGWMIAQMVMLHTVNVLQLAVFGLSAVIMVSALRRRFDERVDAASSVT